MPRWACSNRPARRFVAPVNAPRSCPNNSVSPRVGVSVRELENAIERAIILSRDGTLLIEGVFNLGPIGSGEEPIGVDAGASTKQDRSRLREVERSHIVRVCEEYGWRIKGPDSASVRLELKPSTLYFRMQKLGIVKPA